MQPHDTNQNDDAHETESLDEIESPEFSEQNDDTTGLSPGLYLVATPIGNLEDITLRALRILREVDQVAAEDTRTARKLFNAYDLHKSMFSLYRDNEEGRIPQVLDALSQGKRIALISEAGMPGISDPGYLLIRHVLDAGHKVIPIPGPSAVITALVPSGLPCDRFVFLGFLPARSGRRRQMLTPYLQIPATLVLYASPHRLVSLLDDLIEILGDRNACIAREITKKYEEFYPGTLSSLKTEFSQDDRRKGEFVLMIEGFDGQLSDAALEAQPSQEDAIQSQLQTMFAQGMRPPKIARQLATHFSSLSRQDAYQLVMEYRERYLEHQEDQPG